MSHLQKVGIKHSALRSSTILISHDGIIQIYDPITTGAPTNYDNLLNHRSTPHIYLSPEQTEALREEKLHHNGQSSKGDIWTLGMIVLEAGLLSYQDDCYRDQCSRIHW
jgi:serine/threonine protein kinase